MQEQVSLLAPASLEASAFLRKATDPPSVRLKRSDAEGSLMAQFEAVRSGRASIRSKEHMFGDRYSHIVVDSD